MCIEGQGHFFTIYFPGFVCFVFTRPRYQVSVYRTIGPLVMSSLFLSKTDVGFKNNFAHNVRYGNSATLRIGVALEFLQYLNNHD